MRGNYQIGERVGAILSADSESGELKFLGFGTYQGQQETPRPLGFTASLFPNEVDTWEKVIEHYKDEMGMVMELKDLPTTNPKILLDNGAVVWGAECYWGPEEQIQKHLDKAEKIIEIDPRQVESFQAYRER